MVRTLTGQPMSSPVPYLQVNPKVPHRSSQIMFTMCIFPLWSLVIYLFFFFFLAVDGGYKNVVELLVRNGAEVNGTHSVSGWSCLHQAVYKVIASNYKSNLWFMKLLCFGNFEICTNTTFTYLIYMSSAALFTDR